MTSSLSATLQHLREANGLDLAAVVTSDGLLVDAAGSPDLDAEMLSAVASSGLLMMDALARELGQNGTGQAILEYDHSLVLLTPIDDQLLFVAVTRGDGNLGRLRIVVRRSLDGVRAAAAEL